MATQVMVVGAGPVGMAMAAELARYGVAVRIIDKAAERSDKSKALVVWSRTLELMDRMGCTPAFLATGLKATSANVLNGGEVLGHIELGVVDSPHAYALMIPQSETERLLEEHLGGLGVAVERGASLLSFTQDADGVTAKLQKADGTQESVEAGWLVACDGAHSTVRHQLGLAFTGETLESDWALGDVHLKGMPKADEINISFHADGVLAIFPIASGAGPGRFRIVADVGAAKDGPVADPTMEQIQALLDTRGAGGVTASDPVWLAGFRINERKVKDYRAGRVFLAGDAAHIHSPAGGQGMNTGIQDACNLAWKLALVLKGTCAKEPLLGSYSTERSAVGTEVVKAAGQLTTIGTMKGEVRQAIRNKIVKLVLGVGVAREKMAENLTELKIAYDQSPLNAGHGRHGGPKAGERAPIRAGERPVGNGTVPVFAVFAEGEIPESLARFAGVLEAETRKPFAEGGLWVVRPDGYVGLAAKAKAWGEVEAYLAGVCGQ